MTKEIMVMTDHETWESIYFGATKSFDIGDKNLVKKGNRLTIVDGSNKHRLIGTLKWMTFLVSESENGVVQLGTYLEGFAGY